MAKVIIFGVLDTAQLAHYYLNTDSEHEVVAFTVHEKYLPESKYFEGKPVVAFEHLENIYPPSEFHFFAPMTGSGMNRKRETVYLTAKQKGYKFISYVSSHVTRFNNQIFL